MKTIVDMKICFNKQIVKEIISKNNMYILTLIITGSSLGFSDFEINRSLGTICQLLFIVYVICIFLLRDNNKILILVSIAVLIAFQVCGDFLLSASLNHYQNNACFKDEGVSVEIVASKTSLIQDNSLEENFCATDVVIIDSESEKFEDIIDYSERGAHELSNFIMSLFAIFPAYVLTAVDDYIKGKKLIENSN